MSNSSNLGDGKTVLVVEDSKTSRDLLHKILSDMGFSVIDCEDGRAALSALESLAMNGSTVDAIFSDISMPNMDGIELLRTLKTGEKTKSIPTVLVSSVSDRDIIMTAKNLNVDGYILKPISSQRVAIKVDEIFNSQNLADVNRNVA